MTIAISYQDNKTQKTWL